MSNIIPSLHSRLPASPMLKQVAFLYLSVMYVLIHSLNRYLSYPSLFFLTPFVLFPELLSDLYAAFFRTYLVLNVVCILRTFSTTLHWNPIPRNRVFIFYVESCGLSYKIGYFCTASGSRSSIRIILTFSELSTLKARIVAPII